MSRQLELDDEERSSKRAALLRKAVRGGLEGAVSRAGGVLRGLSLKVSDYEVLMTLRADFPAGPQVGFVGAEDIEACFIKAMRLAGTDSIKWRPDKWKQM